MCSSSNGGGIGRNRGARRSDDPRGAGGRRGRGSGCGWWECQRFVLTDRDQLPVRPQLRSAMVAACCSTGAPLRCCGDAASPERGGPRRRAVQRKRGGAVLTRCSFMDNTAAGYGGGVCSRGKARRVSSPAPSAAMGRGRLAAVCAAAGCTGGDGELCVGGQHLQGPRWRRVPQPLEGDGGQLHLLWQRGGERRRCGLQRRRLGGRVPQLGLLARCIGQRGREIADDAFSASKVENCIVRDGWVGEGSGNSEDDPLFRSAGNPDGLDDVWFTDDDGLRVANESPAIDAGSKVCCRRTPEIRMLMAI